MSRQKKRFVAINMACDLLGEVWERVQVIEEKMTPNLFTELPEKSLLVERSGGERLWVSHWIEIEEYEKILEAETEALRIALS